MFAYLWNNLLLDPFTNLLLALYHLFGDNLGIAVIVLAIILRLAMTPLTKKQTNMTSKMGDLKPRLDKLQKKYKHNPEQLAKEQMKLYKEVGYNPLGCLTSFLPQMFIFIALISVIRTITSGDLSNLYPVINDWIFGNATPVLQTRFLWWDLAQNYQDIVKVDGYYAVSSISYLILALGVGVAQYISGRFTQIMQGQSTTKKKAKKGSKNDAMPPEDMQAQMMKSMNLLLPFMTFSATLGAPAILGLYWLVQVLMFTLQYFIINKDKAKKAMAEITQKWPWIGAKAAQWAKKN